MKLLSATFGKKSDRIAKFWDWARKHSQEFSSDEIPDSGFIRELSKNLKRIHRGLVFEFGDNTLCISADGIKENVPYVLAVVDGAPSDLPIRVVAFRQPNRDFDSIVLNGATYDLDSVRFASGQNSDGKVDVVFFAEGIETPDYEKTPPEMEVVSAIFVLMDATIGEYNSMERIGGISFQPLSMAPAGHRPMEELRDAIGM